MAAEQEVEEYTLCEPFASLDKLETRKVSNSAR